MTPRSMDKTASRVSDDLASAMKRMQEALDMHDAEVADHLANESERADLWTDMDVLVSDVRTILRTLSSDSVSDGSKGVRLDGPELWEIVFGVMKGDVPEELTKDVLSQVAAAVNQSFALDSGTGGQQPVAWRWKWGKTGKWYYGDHDERPNTENPRSPYFGKLCVVEPLYPPTEPKAGVVSEDMVERALTAYVEADIHADCRTALRAALTAALNGDKP